LRRLDRFVAEQIEIDAKYAVYLDRQRTDIESFRRDEGISLDTIEFEGLAGLSNELREKLAATRPATLGQAARIDGMTPAALALLLAEVKRGRARRSSAA
jgi:tRNA uridine 5-carboxymethylaminomethyl modification enzyme